MKRRNLIYYSLMGKIGPSSLPMIPSALQANQANNWENYYFSSSLRLATAVCSTEEKNKNKRNEHRKIRMVVYLMVIST